MSHQYYDDWYQSSSPRRVAAQSNRPSNSSSRQYVPTTARDFASQSTYQPNRERNFPVPTPPRSHRQYNEDYSHSDRYPDDVARSSSSRANNSSNGRSQRRYRLEPPSDYSHAQYPQSYTNDYYTNNPQQQQRSPSPSNYASAYPTYSYDQDYSNYGNNSNYYDQDYSNYGRNVDQYDQNHYQQDTYPSQPSHHRSSNTPSVPQHMNSVQHSNHPSSSVPQQHMSIQRHHPASLLTNFLQSFLGHRHPTVDAQRIHNNNNDDDYEPSGGLSVTPIDMLAFALMMQRPAVLHIQLGNLADLLWDDETPSVGLSDNDIKRIPTTTYRKANKSGSNDDKCAICLSKYKTGETMKRLRCDHYFHAECIDPWLKTSVQCPICRGTQTN
ncbi:hypothetical protein I4U23_003514 [Adineta vaga]|nr:hypothetical protein I4U23_003514 [Adineta vaga]